MATCSLGVVSNDTANGTSYATGSFTPAAGDLLVAFVSASGTVAAGTMTDSLGGTWTKIDSGIYNASASTLYCFIRTASVTNSSMTVTFDCTGDAATGANICVIRVAGMSAFGASAKAQNTVKQENQTSGTPAPAFGSAAQTGNPTIGAIGYQAAANAVTQPTGWTEQTDSAYTTPDNGIEVVTRDSGFTGTTITWGSTVTGNKWASMILELVAVEVHSGSGSLTLSPSFSATGQKAGSNSGSLSTSASFSAAGAKRGTSTGSLAATATVTPTDGRKAGAGTGSLTDTPSFSASASRTAAGTGSLSPSLTLSEAGEKQASGSATVLGTPDLDGDGFKDVADAGALTLTGSFSDTGTKAVSDSGSLGLTATLTGTGSSSQSGASSLGLLATFSETGTKAGNGSATLGPAVSFTRTATKGASSVGSLTLTPTFTFRVKVKAKTRMIFPLMPPRVRPERHSGSGRLRLLALVSGTGRNPTKTGSAFLQMRPTFTFAAVRRTSGQGRLLMLLPWYDYDWVAGGLTSREVFRRLEELELLVGVLD